MELQLDNLHDLQEEILKMKDETENLKGWAINTLADSQEIDNDYQKVVADLVKVSKRIQKEINKLNEKINTIKKYSKIIPIDEIKNKK